MHIQTNSNESQLKMVMTIAHQFHGWTWHGKLRQICKQWKAITWTNHPMLLYLPSKALQRIASMLDKMSLARFSMTHSWLEEVALRRGVSIQWKLELEQDDHICSQWIQCPCETDLMTQETSYLSGLQSIRPTYLNNITHLTIRVYKRVELGRIYHFRHLIKKGWFLRLKVLALMMLDDHSLLMVDAQHWALTTAMQKLRVVYKDRDVVFRLMIPTIHYTIRVSSN